MRGGILFSFVASIALVGCGGSGSETPWPREPSGPALGPSGENAPTPTVVNEAASPEDGEEPGKSERPADNTEAESAPANPRGKRDAGP